MTNGAKRTVEIHALPKYTNMNRFTSKDEIGLIAK
jgi:hypothetical protein